MRRFLVAVHIIMLLCLTGCAVRVVQPQVQSATSSTQQSIPIWSDNAINSIQYWANWYRNQLESPAEFKFIDGILQFATVDYSSQQEELDDVTKAKSWGAERVIRAKCIELLCNSWLSSSLSQWGLRVVHVKGVRIRGMVMLDEVRAPFVLVFENCAIPDGFSFKGGDVEGLYFLGTHIGPLDGENFRLRGSLYLTNETKVAGQINLRNATIEGDICCTNAVFTNRDGTTLSLSKATVEGDVLLNEDFRADGTIGLTQAKIEGSLICEGGEFIGAEIEKGNRKNAIIADGLRVNAVLLRYGFRSKGSVRFFAARVNTDFDCIGGTFSDPNGIALNASSMDVGGNVHLTTDSDGKNFRSEGSVIFMGSHVVKDFHCNGGIFNNPDGIALNANSMDVGGSVYLCKDHKGSAFRSKGSVHFHGAHIDKDFSCEGGTFSDPNGIAINANSMDVGGNVFLRKGSKDDGFRSEGTVQFIGARIDKDFHCGGGTFSNPNGIALFADSITVGGNVFLRKYLDNSFQSKGPVRFLAARIDKDFDCNGGIFNNPDSIALNMSSMDVGGSVRLCEDFVAIGQVHIHQAIVGRDLKCNNAKFDSSADHNVFALFANGSRIQGSLILGPNTEVLGIIGCVGANIGGDVDCRCSNFINPDGDLIQADKVNINGHVFLNQKALFKGRLFFPNAIIRGHLICEDSNFVNPHNNVLIAHRSDVGGDVIMRRAKIHGQIDLSNMGITGNLISAGATIADTNQYAILADGSTIGSVYLGEDLEANGMISLAHTTIKRNFFCTDSNIVNPGAIAINANHTDVHGMIILEGGSNLQGLLSLSGARIRGNISFRNSYFINANKNAIVGRGLSTEGDILFYKTEVKGGVVLSSMTTLGDIDCDGSQFLNRDKDAINIQNSIVGGSLKLSNDFKAHGEVSLVSAMISKDILCTKASLWNPHNTVLNAKGAEIKGSVQIQDVNAVGKVDFSGATIGGQFAWKEVVLPDKVVLDLQSSKMHTLTDEQNSWPDVNCLFIDGLLYEELGPGAPKDAMSRLDWLSKQEDTEFHPQPYEQLAAVLKKSGYKKNAKDVLIEKNWISYEKLDSPWYAKGTWIWYRALGPMIGYGHRPLRIFWMGPKRLLFIGTIPFWLLLGWFVFKCGKKGKLFIAAKEAELITRAGSEGSHSRSYPKFVPIIYSLDVFIPLIDLYQEKYWMPNMDHHSLGRIKFFFSCLIQLYLWTHIIAGWVLTTLFLFGLAGLIPN